MRRNRLRFYFIYTSVFIAFCLGVFIVFLRNGKSMVWDVDGQPQYLPYLIYMGREIRSFFSRALQGDLRLKMIEYSIGMGADVSTVFRSHPLDFLSALVPAAYTQYLYSFIQIFSMYLAGIAFSALGFYWQQSERAVLLGTMVYLFGGYTMKLGLQHPNFLLFLIVMPFMILTADMAMKGEKCLLFALSVSFGFINGYYHMYICTIGLGFYILVRFFDLFREHRVRNFFLMCLRLGTMYLLGVGMAAATLFPSVASLMNSARIGTNADPVNLFTYNAKRYYMWFVDMVLGGGDPGSGSPLAYSVIVLPAIGVLFTGRERRKRMTRIFFILCLVFLLVPAGAYIMTGFSAVNNRWVFLFSLVLGCICMFETDELLDLKGRRLGAAMIVSVLYAAAAACAFVKREADRKVLLIACASLAVCMLVLILVPRLKKVRKAAFPLVMCGVFLSCAINGYILYSYRFVGFVGDFLKNTNTVSQIQNSEFSLLSRIEDDSFYRVDTSEQRSEKENYGLVLGYNGISMYNSFLNGYAVEYLLDQESTGINAIHRIHGLKGHTAAEELALVKYFMIRRGDEAKLPYGFEKAEGLTLEKIRKSKGDEETVYYDVYENKYPLTFGYTYDTCILREDYEKLSAIERQQIQLEAVVTDSVPGEMNKAVSCSDVIIREEAELPEGTEEAVRTETGYQILTENTELSVPFEKKAGYECYVRLGGFYRPVSLLPFYVHTSELTEMIPLRGEGKTYSLERRDYMVYLGSSREEGSDELTFKFPKTGAYELSSIEFIYVPTDGYEEKVSSLGRDALRDVETDINTITGNISLNQGKFMVFAIPYSEGWKLTVDGKKTEIMHANIGYMGTYLTPGDHTIRLDYTSPYSSAGRACALVCWGIFIAGVIAGRLRRKKHGQESLPGLM